MVYKNIRVFVDGEKQIEKGFILIKGNKIEKVGDMSLFKKDYEEDGVINFSGYAIYPGFIDSHCHVGLFSIGCFQENDLNENNSPINAALRTIDAINVKDETFFKALKSGITTVVVGPGSQSPISGDFVALKTFKDSIEDMIIKNPVGIKFSLGENPKLNSRCNSFYPSTRMGTVALIRKQLQEAKFYKKIKTGKKEDIEFNFNNEALMALLKRKIKAFFHCHRADDILTAIRISKEFNLDYSLIHATQGHLIAKNLKNTNVLLGPLICDISKFELKDFNDENAYILNRNNAIVSICSDFPELAVEYLTIYCAIAIKNGLLKKDALNAITKNAAKATGIYDFVGSIEETKLANFAIFKEEEDIFSPYVSPSFVVGDGEIVFKR